LAALDVAPGAVGAIAFGSFKSPNWETSEQFIPPIPTRSGVPAVQGENTLYFTLILPAGPMPAGGWPVVIFGHGFTDSKQGAPLVVASTFASHGLATIAINVVGHGGGAAGTLTIVRTSGDPVIIPDGGRGIDQDGNGTIDSTEGSSARPPRVIIGNRDGLRQTVADLMQLVRVIETGGIPGLSHRRIYYSGQSFGGIYGVKLLALEDSIRAGVPNVPGGAIIEIARLSPSFRALVGIALASRVPALLNAGPLAPPAWGFNENVPLRDVPPVINTVPGAMAIQEVLDNTEWVSQSGNPVAYAPHLRKRPLHETDPGPVIIQFAKGDMTVPNPTASAIIRAGELTDRTSYFRNDLVRAAIPTGAGEPSHVPDRHRDRRGRPGPSGANADRDLLRERRRRRGRPGRRRTDWNVLRGADRRPAAGGAELLTGSANAQCARLGAGSTTGSRRGGRNVNAIATAPRPMPNEPM
jgi:dienelactone hydrolase